MEANKKRKQSQKSTATSPLNTPQTEANKKGSKVKKAQQPAQSTLQPNGKKKVRTKRYNMNEIAMLLTSSVKQN